jgi:thioesterase domain-containing protein
MRRPHDRVEDMAAHYIAAIRTVQPEGPYFLGGWSLGGNLAFETARQLSEQAQEVRLLALFDAAALPDDRKPEERDFLPMVMELFPEQDNLPLERLRAMMPQEQLAYFVRRAAQAEIVPPGGDYQAGKHVFEVFNASMQAMMDYRQKAYRGKVTLFCAEHREDWFNSSNDPELGWGAWAHGGVEVHQIPCGHVRMVHPPYVRTLADTLRRCLAQAEATG